MLTHFINTGLVDEMLLAIHPLVIGGGAPLFTGIDTRKWFEVAGVTEYDTGVVQVRYVKKDTEGA